MPWDTGDSGSQLVGRRRSTPRQRPQPPRRDKRQANRRPDSTLIPQEASSKQPSATRGQKRLNTKVEKETQAHGEIRVTYDNGNQEDFAQAAELVERLRTLGFEATTMRTVAVCQIGSAPTALKRRRRMTSDRSS